MYDRCNRKVRKINVVAFLNEIENFECRANNNKSQKNQNDLDEYKLQYSTLRLITFNNKIENNEKTKKRIN